MSYQHVITIIPSLALKKVEKALSVIGIPAVNVVTVRGYGEYKNYFQADCMDTCSRLEVFCETTKLDEIIKAIAQAAHGGLTTDGIIAVNPIDS